MSAGVKRGNIVDPTKAPDGGARPAPDDPEFTRQKALAEEIMQEGSEVLRKLAE